MKKAKMTSDRYRDGFDAGYKIGLREGYSEGRAVATRKDIKRKLKKQ